jgi:hypothetical protein
MPGGKLRPPTGINPLLSPRRQGEILCRCLWRSVVVFRLQKVNLAAGHAIYKAVFLGKAP